MRLDYKGTTEEQAYAANRVKAFLAMTPQEVETWLNTHVTDLASAKDALMTLGMLLRTVTTEVQKLRS